MSKAKALLYMIAVIQHKPNSAEALLMSNLVDPVRAKFSWLHITELVNCKILKKIRVSITCVESDACAEPSSVIGAAGQLRQFK